MIYSRLRWNQTSASYPSEVLSEYGADGWEVRKVELFADGSSGFAGAGESSGGIQLALISRPADEDVVLEPECEILDLTAEEFENAWSLAHESDQPKAAATANSGGAYP